MHCFFEVSGLRQGRSVLAIPVPVSHPSLPTFSAAVLTIGLPDAAGRFEVSTMLWGSPLARISDAWGNDCVPWLSQGSCAN